MYDSWEREIIILMTSVSSYRSGWGRNAAQPVGKELSRELGHVLVCSESVGPICRNGSLGQHHFSAVPASATEVGEVRLWELEP